MCKLKEGMRAMQRVFVFQAEDGIRDVAVTGVQTCALPISPEAKDAFSVEVARAWERTLEEAPTPQTRKVALRTAMVLGHDRNSVFPVLRRLVEFGLGGRKGGGNQNVSWIHQGDFFRALEWLIARGEFSGPINLTQPEPGPNPE